MAVTDRVLQLGPVGPRRVPTSGIAEVGTGIVASTGALTIDSIAGNAIVVNNTQGDRDLIVRGVTDTSLLWADTSTDQIGVGVMPTSKFDVDGALTVRGMAAPELSVAGTGRVYFDSTANKFLASENNGAYAPLVTSTGSTGQVAFYTASGVLGGEAELFWDAGSNLLGIGGAPGTALTVTTGQVSTASGLVSAPSYSFIGDLNSGLYSAGADDVRIATGGIDRVLARTTGVTLQGAVESFVSGTGTTLTVRMGNSGAGADEKQWAFVFDSAVNTNAFRLVTENDALSSNVEILSVDRSGNMGLGTTTPGAKLDVRGSVIINELGEAVNVRIEGDNEANLFVTDGTNDRVSVGGASPSTKFEVRDTVANVSSSVNYNDTVYAHLTAASAGSASVGTSTAHDFNVVANGTARITVQSAGAVVFNDSGAAVDVQIKGDTENNLFFAQGSTDRVGFGTATPSGRVEIRDDSGTNLVLTKRSVGVGNNDLAEFRTDAFTSGERHLFKWTSNDGALVIGRYGMEFDASSNTIDFVWRDMFNTAATSNEVMRLKGNGRLGLGVTNAATRLDMNGAFSMRGSAAPAVSPAGEGRIYFDSISNTWKISEDGSAYVDLLSVGSIGGTGTANQIAFFTAGTTISSDSDLYWDPTENRLSVASGASPNTTIDMTGALSVRGSSAPAVAPAGQGRLYFDSTSNRWKISENGEAYVNLLSSLGVTGSGGNGRLAFWNGTTSITGDTSLFWIDGSNFLGVNEPAPTSTIHISGSLATAVKTESTSTALDASDNVALVDASGGAVTLTLPAAASAAGREYRIKKIDSSSFSVIIDPNASETIDGQATLTLDAQYEAVSIISNGSNWFAF